MLMEYREAHGDSNFFDLDYRRLMSDPIQVMREIYQVTLHSPPTISLPLTNPTNWLTTERGV